jgi:hypothetical protein
MASARSGIASFTLFTLNLEQQIGTDPGISSFLQGPFFGSTRAAGGLELQGEMHAFMAVVLLRVA